MSDYTLIRGGRVIDPGHAPHDAVRDLWIANGRIVAEPDPGTKPQRTIDASGYIVMAGGIDMHSHIAGSKVNLGRSLWPELRRNGEHFAATADRPAGSLGVVPTTYATGYKYAGLGYTTVFDAAVAPLLARVAHHDLQETPNIDKGCFLLVGNDRLLLETLAAGERQAAKDYLAWLLKVGGGYAFKLVNPGGVESWKQGRSHDQHDLDAAIPDLQLTPRAIIDQLAQLASELQLPHPVHIHCNNLGLPGNWRTTLETIRALAGQRAHLTHIQYHSYLGGAGDETTFGSAVEKLVAAVMENPNLSIDIGQVLFGPTISMTGDSAAAQYLGRKLGGLRISHDLEGVGGCGVFPIEYKNKSVVHAWQFVIGLQWFLMMPDPWRMALTTDHPNGATFWRYPYLIRMLMDANFRREELQKLPTVVREQSGIMDLQREYTLSEVAVITRAAPAKLLGLTDRGHLGLGAVADVTIYAPQSDYEAMFQVPVYTLKSGTILVERGELRALHQGALLRLLREYDAERTTQWRDWITQNLSIDLDSFGFATTST